MKCKAVGLKGVKTERPSAGGANRLRRSIFLGSVFERITEG